MITRRRLSRSAGIIFLGIASIHLAHAIGKHPLKKKAHPQLPTASSVSSEPIRRIRLDSTAPVAPQVTFENGQLTIIAENSTLEDILSAIRKQTDAQVDVPDARERVVTHLGPGPAPTIVAELLNGSGFDYVLLGSTQDASVLTRVILLARSAPAANTATPTALSAAAGNHPSASAAGDASAASNGDEADSSDRPGSGDEPLIGMSQEQLQLMQQGQQQSSDLPPTPGADFSAPEIDGAAGLSAVALIISIILILKGRREI